MSRGISADAQWRKSSHSSGDHECVEVAFLHNGSVGVRDSKNTAGYALILTPERWDAFTTAIRSKAFAID